MGALRGNAVRSRVCATNPVAAPATVSAEAHHSTPLTEVGKVGWTPVTREPGDLPPIFHHFATSSGETTEERE